MRAAAPGAAFRGGAQASSGCLCPASAEPVLPADPELRTVSTFRPPRLFRVRTQAGARPYQRGGREREAGTRRGAEL